MTWKIHCKLSKLFKLHRILTFQTLKLQKILFNLEFVSRGFDNIEKKSWARTFSKMQIKITNFKVKKNWPLLVWPQNSNKFRENSGLKEFNIFQNSKLKPEIKHKTCLFVVYLIFRNQIDLISLEITWAVNFYSSWRNWNVTISNSSFSNEFNFLHRFQNFVACFM